eukprot:gb/GECH01014765.1/.p1 GENE.gb/GECH01014765.1/~~gb/GECH01014765.1/.p1  ORF type:complete len:292 (+),score=56.59 gb/GECH01014765.1/:1-876(+)
MHKLIELNVNEEHITVLRSTLCCMEECSLTKIFSSNSCAPFKDSQGRYFMSYNPYVFKFVIEYLKEYELQQTHESIKMNQVMLQLLYKAPFDELIATLDTLNIPQAKQFIFDEDPLYNNYYIKTPDKKNQNPPDQQTDIVLGILSWDTLVLKIGDKLITCSYTRNSFGIQFLIPIEIQSFHNVYFEPKMPGEIQGWYSCVWDKIPHSPTKMEDSNHGPQKCAIHDISIHMIQIETRQNETSELGTYTTFDRCRYYLIGGQGPFRLDDVYFKPSGSENAKFIETQLIQFNNC